MARLEHHENYERVVLSERNLLALLSKLYTPGSACTLQNNDTPLGVSYFEIVAEPDDTHYASASRNGAAPGEMHPTTERILNKLREVLKTIEEEDGQPTQIYAPRILPNFMWSED